MAQKVICAACISCCHINSDDVTAFRYSVVLSGLFEGKHIVITEEVWLCCLQHSLCVRNA